LIDLGNHGRNRAVILNGAPAGKVVDGAELKDPVEIPAM
jgi:hypothetical protein